MKHIDMEQERAIFWALFSLFLVVINSVALSDIWLGLAHGVKLNLEMVLIMLFNFLIIGLVMIIQSGIRKIW